jgi:hypothetical protein
MDCYSGLTYGALGFPVATATRPSGAAGDRGSPPPHLGRPVHAGRRARPASSPVPRP